jgi:hypothetical protein
MRFSLCLLACSCFMVEIGMRDAHSAISTVLAFCTRKQVILPLDADYFRIP